jgi:predicted metal-dependent hydrolase
MNHPFLYEIIYSSRRTLAIQITADGRVKVRSPQRYPQTEIDRFLSEKETWILKHISEAKQKDDIRTVPLSTKERERYIQIARHIFLQKTSYYAKIMHISYGRISIREQKTRWGSCSSAGNLNFNWRLIFAPEAVLTYVVVHELAHRLEMNHSPAFYSIVESVLPDYKKSQKWLRSNGHILWSLPEKNNT